MKILAILGDFGGTYLILNNGFYFILKRAGYQQLN